MDENEDKVTFETNTAINITDPDRVDLLEKWANSPSFEGDFADLDQKSTLLFLIRYIRSLEDNVERLDREKEELAYELMDAQDRIDENF